MPELPEVETVVRSIAPRLVGRRILSVTSTSSRVFRHQQPLFAACLPGQRILSVARYGKNILLHLEQHRLRIHLGMTGKLLFAPARSTHPRATFALDDGLLVYDDIRQFGRLELLPAHDGLPALGPDALDIPAALFVRSLRAKHGAVKNLLLNQSFVCGIGNIYADEALHRARIHPLCPANRVSPAKARALHQAIQHLLRAAIAAGGSSISDYVDGDGNQGSFQQQHQVYGKHGQPCPRCASAIARIVLSQRSAHFCPRCQRLPETPRSGNSSPHSA